MLALRDCQHIRRGQELGEEIGGRGNPWRFEHPLFRKTESLPGQLLRSHHKLKSRPPAWSVPFLTTLSWPKRQLVVHCPREALGGQERPLPSRLAVAAASVLRQGRPRSAVKPELPL